MTNILVIGAGGALEEIDHALAAKALAIASGGSVAEVTASGMLTVIALGAGGGLTEIAVTFGGASSQTPIIPTPTWTF